MFFYKLLLVLAVLPEAVFVPLYIKAMWPERNKKSLVLKMLCSTLFICTGVLAVVISGGFSVYARLVLSGLVCGWVGDFFLHAGKRQGVLLVGLLAFLGGHIFYIIAFIRAAGDSFPDAGLIDKTEAAVFILLMAAALLFTMLNRRRFAKALVPVILYSAALVFMFVKAGSLGVRTALSGVPDGTMFCLLLLTGVSLFLISDFLLSVKVFLGKNETRKLAALNIATYFAAQSLLACTVLFI
jgi:uncharacterized membrane protein YhhN